MSFICLSTKLYKCVISNMHNLSIIQNNDKSTRTFHPTLKHTEYNLINRASKREKTVMYRCLLNKYILYLSF